MFFFSSILTAAISLSLFLPLFENCENITDLANGVILGKAEKGSRTVWGNLFENSHYFISFLFFRHC